MEGQIKNYNNRRDQFQTKQVGHSGTLCNFYPRRILADSNFDKRRHYLGDFLLYFQYLILFRFLRTNGPKFFNIFSKNNIKKYVPMFWYSSVETFFRIFGRKFLQHYLHILPFDLFQRFKIYFF